MIWTSLGIFGPWFPNSGPGLLFLSRISHFGIKSPLFLLPLSLGTEVESPLDIVCKVEKTTTVRLGQTSVGRSCGSEGLHGVTGIPESAEVGWDSQ